MRIVKNGYTFVKVSGEWVYQCKNKGVTVFISGEDLGELILVIDKLMK